MKCNVCDHDMKALFTSMYCAYCESNPKKYYYYIPVTKSSFLNHKEINQRFWVELIDCKNSVDEAYKYCLDLNISKDTILVVKYSSSEPVKELEKYQCIFDTSTQIDPEFKQLVFVDIVG